jgi:hypothetical protein
LNDPQVVAAQQEAMKKTNRKRKASESSLATQRKEEIKLLRNSVRAGNLVSL